MPIYEYRCEKCGTVIEKMQRMSDAPLVHCDACGEDALKKMISQTSFVLKGSGWYATDYKAKPSESGGASASTKSESKGESSAAKSESKSESSSSTTTKSDASSSSSSATSTAAPTKS
ncbi:MAG: zinc ribbon domain-containing protein [Myxococcota bacterium]